MVIDDIDDDLLVLTAISDTSAVSLFISDDTVLTIHPDQNWNGFFTLSGIVTDTSGLSDTTEFLVSVQPVNDPPSINDIPDTSFFEDASSKNEVSGISFIEGGSFTGCTLTKNSVVSDKPEVSVTIPLSVKNPFQF